MWFVHLTDLHMSPPGKLAYGVIDSNARVAAAIATIQAFDMPPDLVVVTGDIADRAEPETYGGARDLLAGLDCPVLLVPGNHDDPAAMKSVFGNGLTIGSVDAVAHRFFQFDTSVPGRGEGAIKAEDLCSLDARLAAADHPVFILLHHPPGLTGAGDRVPGALDAEADLAAVLGKWPGKVAALLCGHVHRPQMTLFAGVPLLVGPSTAYGKLAPPAHGADGLCLEEPASFFLHQIDQDGALVTQPVICQHCGTPLHLRNGQVLVV